MRKSTTPNIRPTISYGALVGQVILRRRKLAKLDQSALAEALGISQSAYSRLEKGESSMTLPQLRSIALRLGCSSTDLIRDADQLETHLQISGVTVTEQKDDQPGAILLALGILAALIAAGGK
jgi:transcriptional regulator with XRE-family HTH domain